MARSSALLILGLLAVSIPNIGSAQHISGSIRNLPPEHDAVLFLRSEHGVGPHTLDSVRLGEHGEFSFAQKSFPQGFYKLALNDSDAVDLIIDPREPAIQLEFTGVPLQRNIRVVRSDENKRLWEYKLVSREAQAVRAAAFREKQAKGGSDAAADSVIARADQLQREHLIGLVVGQKESFFAQVVRADMALDSVRGAPPMAIMRVFDFSHPGLLRSSVYDKAVLYFLRNIQAVTEEQFLPAVDSLMDAASHDADCSAYMLHHLIDVFATYGPEAPLRHLIDHYATSGPAIASLDPATVAKVQALQKVTIGALAPEVDLPDSSGTRRLKDLVAVHRFTVVFFYSSSCEHCHEQMPGLKALYERYPRADLGILGFALDADREEFERTVADEGLTWPGFTDLKGWGSPITKAFQVHATPSFFVLDSTMRIRAKPVDTIEVERFLQKELQP